MPRKRPTESSWDSDDDLLDEELSGIHAFRKSKDDSEEEFDEDALLGLGDDTDKDVSGKDETADDLEESAPPDEDFVEIEPITDEFTAQNEEEEEDLIEEDVIDIDVSAGGDLDDTGIDTHDETQDDTEGDPQGDDVVTSTVKEAWPEAHESSTRRSAKSRLGPKTAEPDIQEQEEHEPAGEQADTTVSDMHDDSVQHAEDESEESESDEEERRERFKTERKMIKLTSSGGHSNAASRSRTEIPDTLEISKEEQDKIEEFLHHKGRGKRFQKPNQQQHQRGKGQQSQQQQPHGHQQQQFQQQQFGPRGRGWTPPRAQGSMPRPGANQATPLPQTPGVPMPRPVPGQPRKILINPHFRGTVTVRPEARLIWDRDTPTSLAGQPLAASGMTLGGPGMAPGAGPQPARPQEAVHHRPPLYPAPSSQPQPQPYQPPQQLMAGVPPGSVQGPPGGMQQPMSSTQHVGYQPGPYQHPHQATNTGPPRTGPPGPGGPQLQHQEQFRPPGQSQGWGVPSGSPPPGQGYPQPGSLPPQSHYPPQASYSAPHQQGQAPIYSHAPMGPGPGGPRPAVAPGVGGQPAFPRPQQGYHPGQGQQPVRPLMAQQAPYGVPQSGPVQPQRFQGQFPPQGQYPPQYPPQQQGPPRGYQPPPQHQHPPQHQQPPTQPGYQPQRYQSPPQQQFPRQQGPPFQQRAPLQQQQQQGQRFNRPQQPNMRPQMSGPQPRSQQPAQFGGPRHPQGAHLRNQAPQGRGYKAVVEKYRQQQQQQQQQRQQQQQLNSQRGPKIQGLLTKKKRLQLQQQLQQQGKRRPGGGGEGGEGTGVSPLKQVKVEEEEPMDEETRQLKQKLAEQKRLREEIIRKKELRRQQMASQRRQQIDQRLSESGVSPEGEPPAKQPHLENKQQQLQQQHRPNTPVSKKLQFQGQNTMKQFNSNSAAKKLVQKASTNQRNLKSVPIQQGQGQMKAKAGQGQVRVAVNDQGSNIQIVRTVSQTQPQGQQKVMRQNSSGNRVVRPPGQGQGQGQRTVTPPKQVARNTAGQQNVNRTVLVSGQPLVQPNVGTKKVKLSAASVAGKKRVEVKNLTTTTTEQQLLAMCSSVGRVEYINLMPDQKKAIISFSLPGEALAFSRKYQRHMLDLSCIHVTILPS
ncbi:RNA-binding protein 33 isoform X2 [Lingula anatina]|uniref:RNA-binding protein 33 isoform X2 n=1 Tax=Lingula anatina TaxID=7574 RepID=A0A1S3K6L0_LINAN|nr:RNA-binding protein 33 isoform X2 [Lingula anatina]|eukprot:XP_013417891.1 RNA-binding protein 33 isoform X2 [Lingula anatina]